MRHQYRYRALRQFRCNINFGTVVPDTLIFGECGMTIILIPATSVSSVRHQYRYRTLREVHYINLPAPETSVCSVRHGNRHRRYRYRISFRYRTLRKFRYYINTVTGYFSKFDTTLIPVPDISVSAVWLPHRYREYRYRTVHTLLIFSSVVIVLRFLVSLVLLGRNFEFPKTPRESFLAASD